MEIKVILLIINTPDSSASFTFHLCNSDLCWFRGFSFLEETHPVWDETMGPLNLKPLLALGAVPNGILVFML